MNSKNETTERGVINGSKDQRNNMDKIHLMPLALPAATSASSNANAKGKLSFLKRMALGFGLLALLGLLYVPAYHSAQGPLPGLGEIPIPSPSGMSHAMASVVQLPGWSYDTTRDVHEYIEPNINTAIISPVGICTPSQLLMIIICSAVMNQKAREAIRDTWANKTYLDHLYNSTVRVAFLLGQSDNETSNELIESENLLYNDIIQEKFFDSYNNLTLKSVMMLKWVTSNCGHVKYLMKTDDDMFVNVDMLFKLLKSRPQSHDTLIGSLICNAKPIADPKNKWYMPKYMYSEKTYPNYLSGTGYVMSLDVVHKLYQAALDTPLLYLEDVYITGVCARRAKLHPTDNGGFSFVTRKLDPCIYRGLITAHKVSTSNLYTMWKKLSNTSLICTNSSLDKKHVNLSRNGRSVRYSAFHKRIANSRCV